MSKSSGGTKTVSSATAASSRTFSAAAAVGGGGSGSLLGKLGNGDEVKTSSMSKYVDKGEEANFARYSDMKDKEWGEAEARAAIVKELHKIKEGNGVKIKGSYYIKDKKGSFFEVYNGGMLANQNAYSVANEIAKSSAKVVWLKAKGSK